jgi:hypothetical protein
VPGRQIRSGDLDVDVVASQFALGVVLFLARHAAGREVRPLHLGLASAAPPRYRELAGRFGTRRIDFGAECSTMTLAAADLALPLPGADGPLAAVLREHAASVIAAQAAASAWADRLRHGADRAHQPGHRRDVAVTGTEAEVADTFGRLAAVACRSWSASCCPTRRPGRVNRGSTAAPWHFGV